MTMETSLSLLSNDIIVRFKIEVCVCGRYQKFTKNVNTVFCTWHSMLRACTHTMSLTLAASVLY